MIYDDFIDWLEERELSKNTVECYKYALKQFFEKYSEFNKHNLIQFKKELMARLSPKTVSIRITALNEYAKFLGKPEMGVRRIRVQKKFYLENVPNDEEYKILIAFLKKHNKKFYWIVRFLAGTGCRVSELIQIKKCDLSKGVVKLHSKGKERTIMIPKNLIEDSKDFFEKKSENDFLFESQRFKQKAISTRGVDQILRDLGMKAGIRKEVLHPHAFRHFFAIKMLKATNNDISLVSNYLGHSNIATTAIYTMRTLEEQEKQLNNSMTW